MMESVPPDTVSLEVSDSPVASDVPILFIGVARSGTTLLGDLANRYLDVAAVNEGSFEHWLAGHNGPNARQLADDRQLDALLRGLAQHEYFKLLYLSHHPDVNRLVRALRERIRVRSLPGIGAAVLQLTAEKLGRKRLGHEDPRLIDDLDKVLQVFPGCRLVHIVRDPRDGAASILRFPWGANNVVVAAWDWNRKVTHAQIVGARLGPERYLQIRYEDLLQKPKQTMAALMHFVCREVDPTKLRQFIHEMESNPRRNNSGKWRQQLTPRQVKQIEACAGEQMKRYGYLLEFAPLRMARARYAFWKLHHRAVQLRRIVAGKLTATGAAKLVLGPDEELGRTDRADTPTGQLWA